MKNGDLIGAAEKQFEAFVTCDQNIRYQQNVKEREIAILVLPTNDWTLIRRNAVAIVDAAARLKSGDFVELTW